MFIRKWGSVSRSGKLEVKGLPWDARTALESGIRVPTPLPRYNPELLFRNERTGVSEPMDARFLTVDHRTCEEETPRCTDEIRVGEGWEAASSQDEILAIVAGYARTELEPSLANRSVATGEVQPAGRWQQGDRNGGRLSRNSDGLIKGARASVWRRLRRMCILRWRWRFGAGSGVGCSQRSRRINHASEERVNDAILRFLASLG